MFARRRSKARPEPARVLCAVLRNAHILLLGHCIACADPETGLAQNPLVATPPSHGYEPHIAEAARRFRLPRTWIGAVLRAESAGDQRAISRKGAMGLMQIVPETWLELRGRYRLGNDPFDPHDNIIAGSAYIRELLDRYGSPGWIAAYNAGPGRYEASLKGRRLPRETRAYVAAILSAIGSAAATKAASPVRSTPIDWRKSPLFVVQPTEGTSAESDPVAHFREGTSQRQAVREVSNVAVASRGLFVGTGDKGTEP
ncbi:lytic transglycosylase domain-containing protein [Mesorhizobium jarvisii]|uniref:lytic transglycosylase domain-containing protein n=1 Tax=Mesorhizobium jarvisii TaxID=1777867 RepID=UPI001F0A1957|nr:transglycosylase SLT domain-containing protein [Mesorhizobium jarvisii]MCH4559210.1 transglycosylase SLT domain-containing protein [Mesorhizobium jarvisii]